MTTTHLATAPSTDVFNSGVGGAPLITSAGVDVDNSLVSAIQAAAAANGVTLLVGTGGATVTPSQPWIDRVVRTTGAYTAVAGDLVLADTTNAGFTVTLPASPATGQRVGAKNVGTNILTVVAAGKTIEGDANATVEGQWAGATFEYDGANWFIQATR